MGTILFFNLSERYSITGPELLHNATMQNHLAGWAHSSQGAVTTGPDNGSVCLHSDLPGKFIYITQHITGIERFPLLRLAYDTRTESVSPGHENWMTARIVLDLKVPGPAPARHYTYTLTKLLGTRNREHHEAVFARDTGISDLGISAQLAKATGTLCISNLSLHPVTEKKSFHDLFIIAGVIWAVVIIWLSIPMMLSAHGNAHRTAILLLGSAILIGVLLPENLKFDIGDSLFPTTGSSEFHFIHSRLSRFGFSPVWPEFNPYKAGHFALFAILSATAFRRRPYPVSRAGMFGYLLLFALVTETLQLFMAGRTAQLGDLVIDSSGIFTGLLITGIFRLFHHFLMVRSR